MNNGALLQLGGNTDFMLAGSYPWFDIQVIGGNAPITLGVTGATGTSATASTWSQHAATQLVNMGGNGLTGLSGITTSYTGSVNLALAGTNTRGGSSFFDFLSATNTTVGATTPTKTFRITSTGQLQILNNAYTSPPILILDDTGNMTIPSALTLNGGISYHSYSGFLYIGSGAAVTLTASQNGYVIQLAGANVILPLGSSVALGGNYTFINNSASNITITVNNTSTEFIYNGGALSSTTRSLTIQPGETLVLMSRGNTEWDVVGGSASMRYQATPPVLKSSIINQAPTTIVANNTIKAYMASNGAMWLGSNTGSAINLYGQATITYFGAPPSGSTISLASLNSMISAVAAPSTGRIGDSMVAIVTDTTNACMYRITSQQYTTSQSGNYNLVIEQLA